MEILAPIMPVVLIGLIILIRVGLGSVDKQRITDYVEGRGGRIMSISWAPFGRGWFGEKNDRIYEVVYYDNRGNQHLATCKTSMWSGVYWTEDRIGHRRAKWYGGLPPRNTPGDPVIRHIPEAAAAEDADQSRESIDEEIARLRRRLTELEDEQANV